MEIEDTQPQVHFPPFVDFSPKTLADPQAFDMLFLNFYRLGYEPYQNNPLHLTGHPLLKVVLNPLDSSFSSEENRSLAQMSEGERVLVLVDEDDAAQEKFAANLLRDAEARSAVLGNISSLSGYQLRRAESIFESSDHLVNIEKVNVGRGQLILFHSLSLLSRRGLGAVFHTTTDKQKQLCKFQYILVQMILSNTYAADQLGSQYKTYLDCKS